jgi:hypothetical protein
MKGQKKSEGVAPPSLAIGWPMTGLGVAKEPNRVTEATPKLIGGDLAAPK